VLVAVEHVQVGGAHQRQQLAHAGLARACLTNKQHGLLVAQTPGGNIVKETRRNTTQVYGWKDDISCYILLECPRERRMSSSKVVVQ
jgi:hypothetical protein